MPETLESDQIHIAGLVVGDYCEDWSHWDGTHSLSQWMEMHGVPGISGTMYLHAIPMYMLVVLLASFACTFCDDIWA